MKDKVQSKAISAGSIVDPKPKANEKLPKKSAHGTRTIEYKYFPDLLPFGMTELRLESGKWSIKCGKFKLEGFGGDIEWIVPTFVAYVESSLAKIRVEIEAEVKNDTFGKMEIL